MEAVQTVNSPSFESVWALLQETDRIMKKNAEQHERDMKEYAEQHERDMKEIREIQKATDRQIRRTDSELGRLSKRMGEVVEFMVAPNLCEKFRELGFNFSQSSQRKDVTDKENKISFEIDVFLENYKKAMLVEVKTTPTTENVKEHIKRLEKMRKFADLHGDKRIFLGAVAGVVITDNVKKYILKQGFFAIEPSGETFNIISPNKKPKEW